MPVVDEEQVRITAHDFLKAVAREVQRELGDNVFQIECRFWNVKTGSSTWKGMVGERKVVNFPLIDRLCQQKIKESDLPQQQCLQQVLLLADIPEQHVKYSFLLPLVRHWLHLPDPFDSVEPFAQVLLNEFVDAVAQKRVIARSRDALRSIDLQLSPLKLQEGVSIRQITQEELWEFGGIKSLSNPDDPRVPCDDWTILDIELKQELQDNSVPPVKVITLRETVMIALVAASGGSFASLPLGITTNFGGNASALKVLVGAEIRPIGKIGGNYVIDVVIAERLKTWWPRLRHIMTSNGQGLQLAARRLSDGLGRRREDDAILDYAIGLEALLLPKESINSYRFALRGATILGWEGAERQPFFDNFKEFYDVRSRVIHGDRVKADKLGRAHDFGENTLRHIWQWCFQREKSLSDAIKEVDKRILQ